jgi:hypothetical protein
MLASYTTGVPLPLKAQSERVGSSARPHCCSITAQISSSHVEDNHCPLPSVTIMHAALSSFPRHLVVLKHLDIFLYT